MYVEMKNLILKKIILKLQKMFWNKYKI
jgi:hypothetical protein